MSPSSNRGRPNNINAYNMERFVGSQDAILEPRIGPSVALKYNSGIQNLLYGVGYTFPVEVGFEPFEGFLKIPMSYLIMGLRDGLSSRGGLKLGYPGWADKLI